MCPSLTLHPLTSTQALLSESWALAALHQERYVSDDPAKGERTLLLQFRGGFLSLHGCMNNSTAHDQSRGRGGFTLISSRQMISWQVWLYGGDKSSKHSQMTLGIRAWYGCKLK